MTNLFLSHLYFPRFLCGGTGECCAGSRGCSCQYGKDYDSPLVIDLVSNSREDLSQDLAESYPEVVAQAVALRLERYQSSLKDRGIDAKNFVDAPGPLLTSPIHIPLCSKYSTGCLLSIKSILVLMFAPLLSQLGHFIVTTVGLINFNLPVAELEVFPKNVKRKSCPAIQNHFMNSNPVTFVPLTLI